jgi:hypothetical protein
MDERHGPRFGRHAEGVHEQDLIRGVQEAASDAAIDRANF